MRKCKLQTCNIPIGDGRWHHKYCEEHAGYARPLRAMVNRARERAMAKGLEFNIDTVNIREIFPFNMICPAIGIAMSFGDKSGRTTSPSLDRIDNSKGYTIDNIQIISNQANMMKNKATKEELIRFSEWILSTYEKEQS